MSGFISDIKCTMSGGITSGGDYSKKVREILGYTDAGKSIGSSPLHPRTEDATPDTKTRKIITCYETISSFSRTVTTVTTRTYKKKSNKEDSVIEDPGTKSNEDHVTSDDLESISLSSTDQSEEAYYDVSNKYFLLKGSIHDTSILDHGEDQVILQSIIENNEKATLEVQSLNLFCKGIYTKLKNYNWKYGAEFNESEDRSLVLGKKASTANHVQSKAEEIKLAVMLIFLRSLFEKRVERKSAFLIVIIFTVAPFLITTIYSLLVACGLIPTHLI